MSKFLALALRLIAFEQGKFGFIFTDENADTPREARPGKRTIQP